MCAFNVAFDHNGLVVIQWLEGLVFAGSERDVFEELLVHVPFRHRLMLVVTELFHNCFGFAGHFLSVKSRIGEGKETKQGGVVGILNHAVVNPRFLVFFLWVKSVGGFDFCRVTLDEIF